MKQLESYRREFLFFLQEKISYPLCKKEAEEFQSTGLILIEWLDILFACRSMKEEDYRYIMDIFPKMYPRRHSTKKNGVKYIAPPLPAVVETIVVAIPTPPSSSILEKCEQRSLQTLSCIDQPRLEDIEAVIYAHECISSPSAIVKSITKILDKKSIISSGNQANSEQLHSALKKIFPAHINEILLQKSKNET
jgi:hypothetical protein